MGRSVRSVMAFVFALFALPALAAAQEAVTITGRVTSDEGCAPQFGQCHSSKEWMSARSRVTTGGIRSSCRRRARMARRRSSPRV